MAEPDARRGYILDGFPRDQAQAMVWDVQAQAAGTPLQAVVELTMAADELIERLSGRLVCPLDGESYHVVHRPPRVPGRCDNDGSVLVRRPDDEPGAIRHRMEIYDTVTLPLRDFYRAQGLLRTVDATGDAAAVTGRIIFALRDVKNAAAEV